MICAYILDILSKILMNLIETDIKNMLLVLMAIN